MVGAGINQLEPTIAAASDIDSESLILLWLVSAKQRQLVSTLIYNIWD